MSNRAPIRIVREGGRERIEPTVGGVGTTFLRLLERNGGLWIAWSGGQKTPEPRLMPPEKPRFKMVFAPLGELDISEYYHGMCNRGLWPLMHFMTPNCHFSAQHWNRYVRVNRIFADIAAEQGKADDILWVQDFHLALAPRFVRERRGDMPIGIFWHVPFPPEQLMRILPWRDEFLKGMLGSDLIGFHTQSYADHFINCCERILRLDVDRKRGEVAVGRRRVRVGPYPLGIPADFFSSLAANPRVGARAQRIRRGLASPVMVLGVDRLDYTKGILERLMGFERFLENNPSWHRRVTLVLIAVPSRTKVADYMMLKRQLDELVGNIVGRFSSEGWAPLRYLYTQFGAEELVAYYRAADVALLTPLRDGMNLVAKEYVASHIDDDGVLILSEFAGAAEELSDALLVNPYDADQIAEQLKRAVEMGVEEKATRMRAMREKVHRNNLEHWSAEFLSALAPEGLFVEPPAEAFQA
ncbi:MAG TPA: trehalose-6-phosphate synthase [Candidatus Binataceae bacterium]|jgi:trehalose 6-phosphate synthase/phosphatase|nr:trehalose-6-phosphate synthase [Candidatus Binataceae bacterium]